MIGLAAFLVFCVFLLIAPVLAVPLLLLMVALWVWASYRRQQRQRPARGVPVVVVRVEARSRGHFLHRMWHVMPWNWFG